MGTRWHNPLCSIPEVITDEKTKIPRCRSCDEFPRLAELIASVRASYEPPPIPPDERFGDDLGLFWPASVPYTKDSPTTLSAGSKTNALALENKSGTSSTSPAAGVSVSPIYAHQLRLEEFRLLYLTPKRKDDSEWLCAELEIFTHDNCPEYEAVSYTWGGEDSDSTPCKPIFIGPYWDILLQTKNCWAMLDTMRPRIGQRVLWIDAICINQESYIEREDQVAKMCHIYEESLRVLVFLGLDIVEPVTQNRHATRRRLSVLPLKRMDEQSSKVDGNGVHTLESILRRRYFTRIWVIQELLLARQAMIRIGSTEYWVDHQTSRDIVKKDHEWTWRGTAAPWFQYAAQRSLGGDLQNNLLDVIRMTWNCQSADPRDRIFGILGLTEAGDTMPGIHPNYSISTQHVFIGIFAYCLINLRDTRVISCASGSQSCGQYLSWMPAWKPLALLPELVNHNSASFKQWVLKWQRDFVSQINRGEVEMEKQDKAQRQCLLSSEKWGGFFSPPQVIPFYRKYYLQNDSETIESAAHDILGPAIVQFVPIGLASTSSSWKQEMLLARDQEHHDNAAETIANLQRSGKTPWYAHASVSTENGFLSIPLIHLLCIKDKPVRVSQKDGLRCYRISSVVSSPKLDDVLSKVVEPDESKSATAIGPGPESLPCEGAYLFFVTRTENIDLLSPGQSHVFILDRGSLHPLFLILSQTQRAGVFTLTASSEEILFSSIYFGTPGSSGTIRLQDIRATWNLTVIFRTVTSPAVYNDLGLPKPIGVSVFGLMSAFLGEPSFESLIQASKICENDDNLLDLYLSCLSNYHALHVPSDSPCAEHLGFVELRLKFDDFEAKQWLFPSPERRYGRQFYNLAPDYTVFEDWRANDGTWKRFRDELPNYMSQVVCVRASVANVFRRIRSSLRKLNFLNRLEMDSYCGSEMESPQAWAITSLSGIQTYIGEDFEFNGRTYQIKIA